MNPAFVAITLTSCEVESVFKVGIQINWHRESPVTLTCFGSFPVHEHSFISSGFWPDFERTSPPRVWNVQVFANPIAPFAFCRSANWSSPGCYTRPHSSRPSRQSELASSIRNEQYQNPASDSK